MDFKTKKSNYLLPNTGFINKLLILAIIKSSPAHNTHLTSLSKSTDTSNTSPQLNHASATISTQAGPPSSKYHRFHQDVWLQNRKQLRPGWLLCLLQAPIPETIPYSQGLHHSISPTIRFVCHPKPFWILLPTTFPHELAMFSQSSAVDWTRSHILQPISESSTRCLNSTGRCHMPSGI